MHEPPARQNPGLWDGPEAGCNVYSSFLGFRRHTIRRPLCCIPAEAESLESDRRVGHRAEAPCFRLKNQIKRTVDKGVCFFLIPGKSLTHIGYSFLLETSIKREGERNIKREAL